LRKAYREFFDWIERPELFKPAKAGLEYADVFPLIYLKLRLEGVQNPYSGVKHLLVDEMQDYTPVQYAVLGRLFDCRKTILGDATQAVNPYSASTPDQIAQVLKSAVRVTLNKSYRSSWEIMQFALAISPNPDLVAMERHDEVPRILTLPDRARAISQITTEIEDFRASDHTNLALIAKTQKQAARLHRDLEKAGVSTHLLDSNSSGFSSGVIICTAHLAKGLEFDRVIIPDADAATYHTDMDRNLLYVACTRAMHRLTLITTGAPSPLLPDQALA
jgi:DNA helicase-2/ATP-dependent DNA helicase PcrA